MRGGPVTRLRLFGTPELRIGGREPPPELLWRKHLALLVYLHCAAPRGGGRAQLLHLLWGDKPEAAARHSLNEALRVVRRGLGDEALDTSGDQVTLLAPVGSDLKEVEALLAAGDAVAAAALVGGEFLEGFEVAGAGPFGDWQGAMRLEWQRRGADLLATQAAAALDRGETGRGADLASRAVHLEPGNPAAVTCAMRAEALRGDRAAALRHHDRFASHLADLGLPMPEGVAALGARVRGLAAGPATPARVEAARTRRLPLVGRQEQMQALAAEWIAARGGGARIGVVRGDSGTGKSRLLEEVIDRARLDGATTLLLRAVPADTRQPAGGLRALASGALLDAPGIAAAAAETLAALAGAHPRWGERFPGALRAEPAPIRQAIVDVLRAAAGEAPLLLGVDDAHWIDAESLQVLVGLLRDLRDEPLLLLLAHDAQPARAELEELAARIGRDWPGAQVGAAPLPLPALEALTREVMPTYPEDAVQRLARRIAVDSAGLPLLAVELLHAVAGGLDLGQEQATWPEPQRTLDQTRPGTLPDGVVAAIRLGFRRLSGDALRLLVGAALLGDRESAERLGQVGEVQGSALDQSLDELEWHRWMRAEPRGYAFVARIAREVVARDLVTPGQRRRILERAEAT